MIIVFICSSLEPGYDGVGDYVRRLGTELILQGHEISAIALNDRHLTEEVVGFQYTNGIELPVYRAPAIWSSNCRFTKANQWVKKINPQWLSLQYVPYGFHDKGLPFGLDKHLSLLGTGRNWHIMFHELWVGMDIESSKKYRVLGWLQQRLVKSLLSLLQPKVIHTQCHLYMAQLSKINSTASYLPLFGNIPVQKYQDSDAISSPVCKRQLCFVLFGGIHYGAPIAEFAKEVSDYSTTNHISIKLKLVGRCGNEQQQWVNVWRSFGLVAEIIGEKHPKEISKELSGSTIGICTTPIYLIEKSGAFAAMVEHNLPIICVSRNWQPIGISSLIKPKNVLEYHHGEFNNLMSQNIEVPEKVTADKVSNLFIKNLTTLK